MKFKTDALEKNSQFEYTLTEEHIDNRVWIRVNEPDGTRKADVGILVNGDGVSIDVWAALEGDPIEPVLQPYALWSDFDEDEEE